MKRRSLVLLLVNVYLSALLLIVPSGAQAATIMIDAAAVDINADNQCSLREALANAELGSAIHSDCAGGDVGADTLELSNSTYTLSEVDNTVIGPNGFIPIGTSITINGNGAIIERSTQAATPVFRLFLIGSGGHLTLNDLSLFNGKAEQIANNIDEGNGGAIFNDGGIVVLNKVTLHDHLAFSPPPSGNGGGLFNKGGEITITASMLSNNYATESGGAIYNNSGGLTIKSSTLLDNSANNGGAIFNGPAASAAIDNSTFADNSASISGTGITNSGTMSVINSTLSGHTGLGAAIEGSTGVFNLINTIVANNSLDCQTTLSDNINNLIEDGTCNPALSGDPSLGALADNGGFTQTFALLPGSIAIDAGDNASCAGDPVNNMDQRGGLRPLDGDDNTIAICDIGAYELSSDPSAQLSNAPDVTVGGGTLYQFEVTYQDNTAIDVTTLGSGDVIVNSPMGNISATFVGVDIDNNGSPRVATYSFVPPGGAWDGADNGAYTVELRANQVTDENANAVPAGVLGSFTVALNTAPVVESASFELSDTAANGTVVGTVTASDEQDNILASGGYQITAGNSGLAFTINDSGQISVFNAGALLTAGNIYSLTVEVTDSGGLTGSNTVFVNMISIIFSDSFETEAPPQ